MHVCSFTQANRPASAATGQVIFNLTTGQLQVFDGSVWQPVGGGGDYQPDEVITVFDGIGNWPIPGIVPMDTVMSNTPNSSMTLDPGGWVVVPDEGEYVIRYTVSIYDVSGGPGLPINLQTIVQTAAPSGSGMWMNVIGGDAYAELGVAANGSISGTQEVQVVAPPGGIDVQVGGNLMVGGPALAMPQGSRISVERVD